MGSTKFSCLSGNDSMYVRVRETASDSGIVRASVIVHVCPLYCVIQLNLIEYNLDIVFSK
jgi:hypothetical protein